MKTRRAGGFIYGRYIVLNMANQNETIPDKEVVCDDCLNCVYDEMGHDFPVSQSEIAVMAGDILPDHICEEIEHNGEYGECACSCKRHKKMKIRTAREHWTVEAVTEEGETEVLAQFVTKVLEKDDEQKMGEFW